MVSSLFFPITVDKESWQGPQQTIWFIPLPRAASTAQSFSGVFLVLVPSTALGCPLRLSTFMDKSFEIISYKRFPPSFPALLP